MLPLDWVLLSTQLNVSNVKQQCNAELQENCNHIVWMDRNMYGSCYVIYVV